MLASAGLPWQKQYSLPENFSTKRRIPFGSSFIVTVLQSLYFSLYNGSQQEALQAVKALQKRANYELVPEVILMCNAILSSFSHESKDVESQLGLAVHHVTPVLTR